MKINSVSLSIILVILLFSSCQKENKNNSALSIETNISITDNELKETLYSELFSDVKYIKLEAKDDALIKEVTKVRLVNNKIYILDARIKALFVFGMNGHFLWKIHKLGTGPGEYTDLIDFDIDEEKNELSLFCPYRKIQTYDLDGNFIEEEPIQITGTSFARSKKHILIYTCNIPAVIDGKMLNSQLLVLNKTDKKLYQEVSLGENNLMGNCKSYESSTSFFKYKDEIRFFMPFSPNIYSLKGDSLYVKYHFDAGKYALPTDYFLKNQIQDISDAPYFYGLNSFLENERYCFFQSHINERSYPFIYAKNENQLSYGRFKDDMAFCYPKLKYITDQYLLGVRFVSELQMEYDYSKSSKKGTMLEKVLNETSEDDNPILFLYYFKR